MLPVKIGLDQDDHEATDDADRPTVTGFVSKAGVGVGRHDNDRQFLYVNGRPVEMKKFTKSLNEVWRQYEMKQKPACVLNFHLPDGTVDVNVTPEYVYGIGEYVKTYFNIKTM